MGKRIYLLVGLTGSGKSTTGNIIINKSGELLESPFVTSDGASGCTLEFQIESRDDIKVIDTVGFGDPQFEPNQILEQLRNALSKVNNKVTHVIFVAQKKRFSKEAVEFFKTIQDQVLTQRCQNNSFLLMTNCDEGWVEKNKLTNEHLRNALENCSNRYHEIILAFDRKIDDENDKQRNVQKRQQAVDSFLNYLNSLPDFEEADLGHIQTKEFEKKCPNNHQRRPIRPNHSKRGCDIS